MPSGRCQDGPNALALDPEGGVKTLPDRTMNKTSEQAEISSQAHRWMELKYRPAELLKDHNLI